MSGTVHFLIPGDPETRTGGYLYDRRIMVGLTTLGWFVELHRLSAMFPQPDAAALQAADAVLAALPERALTVIDGLALGAMPTIVARHRERLRLVALVHHPLALETGLAEALRQQLTLSEREALRSVRRVIVTSSHTAWALADYEVPLERCAVVEPGVEPAPLAGGSQDGVLTLLCVASLTPRKGHAVLFHALTWLREKAWRLRCAGSANLDPATAAELFDLVARLGLSARVEFLGQLDESALSLEYRQADLFVLPSWYEGYGMVLTEALAHGLPIVSTTAGAIPGTVPPDAGYLVAPGNEIALAEVLTRVISDDDLRKRLAEGARIARRSLADWPTACRRFAEVLAAMPE